MPRNRKKKNDFKIINNLLANTEERIVDINSVKIWYQNPFEYVDKTIDYLADGIRAHGQITAIVVYTKDNMIRKGNKTWLAMKKAGSKKIRVKFMDFGSVFKANAYGVYDNLSPLRSQMDYALVKEILQSEDFQGVGDKEIRQLTGYNQKELDLFHKKINYKMDENDTDKSGLKGNIEGVNKTMMLVFNDESDYEFFVEQLGLRKRAKTVLYDALQKRMSWRKI